MFQSQVTCNKLWVSRRAATRIRSEIISLVYEKALKRRNFTGVITSQRSDGGRADAKSPQVDLSQRNAVSVTPTIPATEQEIIERASTLR